MTTIVRWPGHPVAERGLPELLAAYHLRTEAEKGVVLADADALPDRYRAEVTDPGAAFADAAVFVALLGRRAVGCVVVGAPVGGRCELKRLWTDPECRGRGIASALLAAGVAHGEEQGAGTVRLTVWNWRADAIALYAKLGFRVTASWEAREDLVCMEYRTVAPAPCPRGAGDAP
ncbi:GNAT family N-acetyltransferase [Streptomyces sp. MS1.HAVA.3]|uniref:GNAT family N-acetyltransferase n=1 Tax=Streptomyces caledonius TaxID=3134107 RepID=A0ABU8U0K6_9ACTN